ncbi:MAG: protein translocase subunit SecD [Anaerolineales bacterium]|jgi:preprotein translocase subunit SecD|nr:protein translocase subunit SecD [Anaerolineales bacterium]
MSNSTVYRLIAILAIIIVAIYIVIPNSPGIRLGGAEKTFVTRLGLDLVGGVQALLEADLPPNTPIEAGAMSAAAGVVENRVNGLGLTEAVVQQAGERRIVVELPGETDPEKALATIRQTALLEFVDMSNLSLEEAVNLNNTTIKTDFGLSPEAISETQPITGTTPISPTFHTVMTGADLRTVQVQRNPQSGRYEIAFQLSSNGAKIFADFTSAHIGQILAIVIDKRVISTPRIDAAITGGQGVISGDFDSESANNLAIQLRYGSLPVPLKVVEVRTVGPTLGQDSLNRSLRAGLIGFSIVILFMGLYYRLPGIAAILAILIYALVTFAIFRFIPVTLTLPGIAGLMLSTGSALDANILIFERIKEELRAGKTLRQSVELGWRRAWPSIRDSNIATLITSGILFWFGSTYGATIVKGFSITLFLGVAVSLFTALVVTRGFIEVIVAYFKSTNFARWFGI